MVDRFNSITIDSSEARTELCNLGVKYPTDKSPYTEGKTTHGSGHKHPYTAVYDLLFSSIKYQNLVIGEIGILDNMSMKCWREYFPNAELIGFEFNDDFIVSAKKDKLKQVTYKKINVQDKNSIVAAFNKTTEEVLFDIIVEDSTHMFEDQIRVVENTFMYLNAGGYLIVEDIFRNRNEQDYYKALKHLIPYFSNITFINTEHKFKHSPGWDNDKLLILIRNNKVYVS